ncbi:MAG: hypothetical protein QOF48_694 [Verrucomicrobiota bacterium]|jgi:2-oxoglutarate dehydrogenase E2 component (dihydrolipoamide succinyltransferase)
MPIEIKIPQVGESISEVQISEWLKKEGEAVQKDDAIAVVDSEKTTFNLQAPDAGIISHILHQAGETVSIGAVVAQLDPEGTAAATPQSSPDGAPTADEPPAKTNEQPPARTVSSRKAAGSPDAEKGTRNPADVPAKAKEDGRAPKKAKAIPNEPAVKLPEPKEEPAPTPAARPTEDLREEIVPMTMLRQTVARRLVEAQQSMAMLTTIGEADLSAVQTFRQHHQDAFQQRHGIKLGFSSFFVKAAIDALKLFPVLNAEVRGKDIVYHNHFDVGIAVATDHGLVVPVLRGAERMSFAETEKAIADLAQRARARSLNPEDLDGGTFTITNGGVFGSLLSTPIINPPQSGILGLHSIEDRPVARGGVVVIRPMMFLALTYDHRIVDGREAVLFLRRIRETIEDPARMLVEV